MTVRLPRPDVPVAKDDGVMTHQWLKALTATNDAVNGIVSGSNIYTDTGTVNAMKIASGVMALTIGLVRYLTPAFTNTSNTVTLNDSGLGAKSVVLSDGSNPAIGQIVAGSTLQVVYTGTLWKVQNLTAASSIIPGNLTVGGTLTVTGATTLTGGVGPVASTGAVSGTTVSASSYIKVPAVLVGSLPSAATAGAGARATVSDSTVAVFNNAVIGSGGLTVPVFSDGATWRIG